MFRFSQAGDQLSSYNISNIQYWNTVNVTKMIGTFYRVREGFNVPIGNWNTSNVTTMAYMFQNTDAFNANISSWNTSNVTQMNSMFESATAFNQDLGNWDVSAVTRRGDMGAMLYGINGNNPYLFDLSGWCVTNVTSQPNDFIHSMPNALRPVWGTCP
jgi:surface protein